MEAGIVGLAYIGKTTLFNALTALGVSGEGSATRPNVGVVQVPDDRLALLHGYIETQKVVSANMQLVDVAGLVAGASEGKGTGNRFLGHLRNVDALLHVVRCYEGAHGPVDPVHDIDQVATELMIADLEVVENGIDNAGRRARTGDKQARQRLSLLEQCAAALSEGKAVSTLQLNDQQRFDLKSFALLSAKPVLYVANVGEDDSVGCAALETIRSHLTRQGRSADEVVAVCARLEAELAELDPSERGEMLKGLGLAEPALNVLARATYGLLGLHSFFTVGPKEIHAWTVPIGATAPEAAGAIHSDFQRGFIRVEVYSVADLEEHESERAIKAAGKMRLEGKNYVIQDGDVCHFLFNV